MTSPGRYHLLLAVAGRPMLHGWWDDEETALRQWTAWIGERGSMPGARITLIDEDTGETLASWPEENPGVVGGGS